MEAQLTPALSYPAQAYAQSFFEEVPTDSRFISTSYMKFPPSSTIDAKKIEFVGVSHSGKWPTTTIAPPK